MLTLNHKKLNVWKRSMTLISNIYELTKKLPVSEKFGLTSQMRRSVVSVASNISEGSSRSSPRERRRFYEISRSSLVELDTQLEVSKQLSYLEEDDFKVISNQMNEIFAMLSKLKTTTE